MLRMPRKERDLTPRENEVLRLVASVEAEDENEAREKARQSGTWRIVGDVKTVTGTVALNVREPGD